MNRAELVAARVGDLPALPQVATKVMELIRAPRTTVKDLEKVIGTDQALTAKVLRISNSAFYGVRGEIATLRRAIVVLGFNSLRSVVLTGASEILHRPKQSCFKERILWEHSLAVALAARTIAQQCGYHGDEEAYVGGLLHDVGKVVMDANVAGDYQQVIERVYNDRVSFLDAENEVFGFDHADVGALVVQRWNLAAGLTEAVRLHHQPMGAEQDPTLCAIISLGNSVCVKLGIGPERDPELNLAELEATLMLTLEPERLTEIANSVKDRLVEEKSQLSLA